MPTVMCTAEDTVIAIDSEDLDLLERLGGSSATVHRAAVRTTGRVVVVKRVGWDRPDVADRLGREATVLQRVQHTSLVRLLNLVEDDTGRALVLAHAPGGSLADRVRRLGPLAPDDVADLGGRLGRALAALHGAGVVHRDVHPGNVLIDAELQPILADLDNALDTNGERLPGDKDIVGAPQHVDPRLFTGAPADPASDLHALATTLWTAATGAPPPRSGPEAAVQLPANERVPAPLREVLEACLSGEAGDAATVASHFEAVAVRLLDLPAPIHRPPAPPVPTAPQPTPPPAAASPTPTPTSPAPPAPAAPSPPVASGPRVVAGGAGGGSDPTTRRWGPAPRPQPVAATVAGRGRHVAAIAALAVVSVALALLGWGVTRDREAPAAPVAAVPPEPCADVTASQGAAVGAAGTDGAPVLADLDGDGCSEVVRLIDGELQTPGGRFGLGRSGDVLLAGDWDGDGRWGVGIYRPGTGAVYLFDDPPGPDATSRPAQHHTPNAMPRVVEAPDGTHRVETTTADDGS